MNPNRYLSHAFKVSLMAHLAIILFIFFQSIVAPFKQTVYIPSLRVDLVALPDHRVNDVQNLKPLEPETKPEEIKPAEVKKNEPDVVQKTDPAAKSNNADVTVSKTKEKNEKLKKALARIRALERVRMTIKGNEVSKGSSLTGEVKKELQTSYFDVVLEKVREHWELPKWLLEKELSAQAAIQINSNGQILNIQLVKSSGNDQFDQEVRRAIQLSNPLPAPPPELNPKDFGSGIILGFPI